MTPCGRASSYPFKQTIQDFYRTLVLYPPDQSQSILNRIETVIRSLEELRPAFRASCQDERSSQSAVCPVG